MKIGEETVTALSNVGRKDRRVRLVLGIGLVMAGVLVHSHGWLRWTLGLAGLSSMLSGVCGI